MTLVESLNQGGKPVAYFSQALHRSQMGYSAAEKEAFVIIQSVKYWSHFLGRKKFHLITNQRAISTIFSTVKRSKIKSTKMINWRLELASYWYDIQYRLDKENQGADALSRLIHQAGAMGQDMQELSRLHPELCHPGISRFLHFAKSKNLAYSLKDIEEVCKGCQICAEIRPTFYKPQPSVLIKIRRSVGRC